MLSAQHPGRIDLGIGRSEGTLDDTIVLALGRPSDTGHGAGYEEQLDQLLAFADLAPLPDGHPLAAVRAGPQGVPFPPVFMLGSSLDSARTAARRGLRYAFAAYTNPDIAHEALRLYRARSSPPVPAIVRTRSSGSRWSSARMTSTPRRWRCRGTSPGCAAGPAGRGR